MATRDSDALANKTSPSSLHSTRLFGLTFIPKEGLENLRHYKYQGRDLSVIANYVLQPFWRWLVEYLPDWMAPNLITLLGFIGVVIAYLILVVWYAPNMYEDAPPWAHLLAAAAIFFYQTMDALDGKQARRTGTSSPLGELFDHGCDALNTTLAACITAVPLKLGNGWISYCSLMTVLVPFYLTQWEEYFTGEMLLGYLNVTEAQICSIAFQLSVVVFGSDFWVREVAIAGYRVPYNMFLVLAVISTGTVTTINNVVTVMRLVRAKRVSLFSAVRNLIPLAVLVTFFTIWVYCSPLHLPYSHPQLTFITLGCLLANLVGRIVVARVCKLNVEAFSWILLPLILISIHSLLAKFYRIVVFNELYFLYGYCAFSIIAYFHFAIAIINDMCTFLNIHCFTIPWPNLATKQKKK
jgi:ethanolaminephosphotransferase